MLKNRYRRCRPALALVFLFSFSSCAAAEQKEDSDFYEGLKKQQEGLQSEAAACFEKALNAANPFAASAAAAALLSMHAAGAELSEAAMAGIWPKTAWPRAALPKAGGSWALALEALETADKEKFLSLLLNGDSRSPDEAALYALEKWRSSITDDNTRDTLALSETEAAVLNGRTAAGRSRYNEALLFFRIALRDSPELFFRYPDLLTDLGRAFQYTASGREGIELFLQWEKTISEDENGRLVTPGMIPEAAGNLVRFRLLFFAARIARQRGEKNIELFEQALPFALEVSPEQSDACIWYILDSSLALGPAATIRYLEKYISQWDDDAYFSDVLDKLSRELILKRQWEDIAAVYAILQSRVSGRGGGNLAKYAWIIGRAVEEGLYTPRGGSPEKTAPSAYRRAAYNAGIGSLYYRSLSAKALGEVFLELPAVQTQPSPQVKQRTGAPKRTTKKMPAKAVPEEPAMEFLLGFFSYDAAAFAPRYIKTLENDLGAGELRRLSEALGAAGKYQESIRLVTLYTRRSGYQMAREDWELLYPRPFHELVEPYAAETGIEPALLYALIRAESVFDPAVVSRAGAAGLSQLMPATAREMAARIHRQGGPDYISGDGDSAPDLFDPAVNIHIGAVYLAYLNERMEDPLLALLAYNGGMNRIRRWYSASRLPPDLFLETVEYTETRNYGRSVMGAAAIYTELYYKNSDL